MRNWTTRDRSRQLEGTRCFTGLTHALDHLNPYNLETQQRLDTLATAFQSRGIDVVTAHQQVLAAIAQIVNTQAAVLSFADIFQVVGVAVLSHCPYYSSWVKAAQKKQRLLLTKEWQLSWYASMPKF